MYTLIGRQKWYWQLLITVVFIALVIIGYLFARSWGYDKARRDFEAGDKVKAAAEQKKIARAEFLEARIAELEPKIAAYEALDPGKVKQIGQIQDKIDAIVEEGKKEDAKIDATTDCWVGAQRTCDRFARLNVPLNCEEYKRRICSAPVANSTPCQ